MQVVPHLFKIMVVLCTVFSLGSYCQFYIAHNLCIYICIYKNCRLYNRMLQFEVLFLKDEMEKVNGSVRFFYFALPAGFVPLLEELPLIARN